jgi:organic hydroperoxide reductase OsmC/OhrA
VARTNKLTLPDEVAVTAKVGIGQVATGYGLAVELIVEAPGMEKTVLESIVAGAHERCPYFECNARQYRGLAKHRLMFMRT